MLSLCDSAAKRGLCQYKSMSPVHSCHTELTLLAADRKNFRFQNSLSSSFEMEGMLIESKYSGLGGGARGMTENERKRMVFFPPCVFRFFPHCLMPGKALLRCLKLFKRLLSPDPLNRLLVIPFSSLQICLRYGCTTLNILSVLTKA